MTFTDFKMSLPTIKAQQALIINYTELLCEALLQDFLRANNNKTDAYKFYFESGRKYHKVIMETGAGSRSVVALVDQKTGAVYKPASFKAPAKGVRYYLLDDVSRENCLSRADWAGGFLYIK